MKVSRQTAQLLQEIIDMVPADDRQAYHYFIFRGKLDFDALYADQVNRKAWLAKRLKEFAQSHDGYDVGTTWNPLTGLGLEGIVFKGMPGGKPPVPTTAWCDWRHLPGYDGTDDCWICKPDKRRLMGKHVSAQFEALREEVAGPSEVNDFFASYFGLFRAMGSAVIDGGRTALVPARFNHLALGLFMRLPQERLYELPDNWERVPQTAFVFAQEIETAIKVPDDATIQEA